MNYRSYCKVKSMQSFRQKFSEMIEEYHFGHRMQYQLSNGDFESQLLRSKNQSKIVKPFNTTID